MGKTRAAVLLQEAVDKAGSRLALAQELGVSTQVLALWTKGSQPRLETIMMLQDKLRIPIAAWVEKL